MTQLIPIQIDADTIIYVEPTDDIQVPAPTTAINAAPNQELTRDGIERGSKGAIEDATKKAIKGFAAMETTIKTYTQRTLNSFKDLAATEVDKVTLEFGLNLGGEAGVPYITKGTAQCSLKITVECNLANQKTD
ncbi:MAG: CU044_2847 family protein [Cyanobacteria bacterium P01_F01_bin.153]